MFHGGENISALVLDVGTHSTKAGYAGEDKPKVVFNSLVGLIQDEYSKSLSMIDEEKMDITEETNNNKNKSNVMNNKKYYVGNNSLGLRRDHLEIVRMFDKDGLIDNFDILEKLWDHAFIDTLKLETKEHPLLQCEPFYNTNKHRERLAEIAFEKYSVPGFFLSKSPVLSCFMSAKQSGLCVEFSHKYTTVVPVHDGYALKNASFKSIVGGEMLSKELQIEIEKGGTKIFPHYAIKKNEISIPKNTSQSYLQYSIENILDDIKESTFKFSDTTYDEEFFSKMPGGEFELPDKNRLALGSLIYKAPEMILNPKHLSNYQQLENELKNVSPTLLLPLSELITNSINKCHSDIYKEMYGNIILCGGTSLIPGLQERLQKEITSRGHKLKPKFIASNYRSERKYSAWIGGSILASLGTFQQLWMSKSEFHENGSSFIVKKCP